MRLLDDQTLELIYQESIRDALFEGVSASAQPRLVIVGGQPGAGKTYAVLAATQELAVVGTGVAFINGDELRTYHPHYEALIQEDSATAADKTGADVGWWVRRGISEAAASGFNTVLETTMRQPAVVTRTAGEFANRGFKIELRVMLAHPEVSLLGIYQRYAGALQRANVLPRFTLPHYHDDALEQMPNTLSVVAPAVDVVRIVDRQGDDLYASTSSPLDPVAALQTLRQRPLSQDRIERIGQTWRQLVEALDRDGVPDVVRAGVRREQQRFSATVEAASGPVAEGSTPAPANAQRRRAPRP